MTRRSLRLLRFTLSSKTRRKACGFDCQECFAASTCSRLCIADGPTCSCSGHQTRERNGTAGLSGRVANRGTQHRPQDAVNDLFQAIRVTDSPALRASDLLISEDGHEYYGSPDVPLFRRCLAPGTSNLPCVRGRSTSPRSWRLASRAGGSLRRWRDSAS